MSEFDELPLLLETKECYIYELPFSDQTQNDCHWRLTVEWKNEKGILFNESFKTMIDFYPTLYDQLSRPEITNSLSWECINYINNELRVHINLAPSKEVSKAAFIEFLDRAEPLRRIGIVITGKAPQDRLSYEWLIDEYPIAEIGHIDFDKCIDWKPKKNESDEQYIRKLLKGTRGNIGELTRTDNYRILVPNSKYGMKYDFSVARQKYLEFKIALLDDTIKNERNAKKKILDTLLADLGYEASKYLHPRFKVKDRRPSIQFSDDLYKQLKAKLIGKYGKKIVIKKRGRYYAIKPISLLQAAFIFDASYVSVEFEEDLPKEMYMSNISLLYNQVSHCLALHFRPKKRTLLKNGQSSHV